MLNGLSGLRISSAEVLRLQEYGQPLRPSHGKSYDLPRQLPSQAEELEKLERKRQELVQWEDGLLLKSRQMEEAVEQFNAKMAKMSQQKAEI